MLRDRIAPQSEVIRAILLEIQSTLCGHTLQYISRTVDLHPDVGEVEHDDVRQEVATPQAAAPLSVAVLVVLCSFGGGSAVAELWWWWLWKVWKLRWLRRLRRPLTRCR